MNKKAQGIAGVMILIMIGLILGVVVLAIINTQIADQTSLTPVVEDPFTGSNSTCVRVTNDCIFPGSTSLVQNATGTDDYTGNFTECGLDNDLFGYSLASGGGCLVCDGGLVNATYTGRSCSYVESAIGRTTLVVIPILLAVALLVFVVGFMVLKK